MAALSATDESQDWLLQGYWPHDGWRTFHVYAGPRERPSWPPSQAKRMRREGYKLRSILRCDEEAR